MTKIPALAVPILKILQRYQVPGIDLFLNPDKEAEKMNIVQTKQGIAKEYFSSSDMASLYPNLFRILWQSTLPCFKVKYHHIYVYMYIAEEIEPI